MTWTVRVTVEGEASVRDMLRRLGTAGPRVLARTAEDVEERVSTDAGKHTKTGALFQSIYLRRDGDAWEVGHDLQRAPHAVFVHWGTRPHVIRPRLKKSLRWPAGPGLRFAKKVNHPGYTGDAWLVRAAAAAPQLFTQHLRMAVASLT